MVVFSCDGCAEVLKKNQVDAHAYRCKSCFSVSCADCLTSFPGDDYRKHTSCLTEVERYEKRGQTTKQTKVTPQQQWMDLLSSSISSSPQHLKHYFETMASLDNVPRKEKPFRNFARNSLKLYGHDSESILNELWGYLAATKERQQKERALEQHCGSNVEENVTPTAAPKALKSQYTTETTTDSTRMAHDNGSEGSDGLTAKAVKRAMKRVLKASDEKALPVKRLRKKVRKDLGIAKAAKGKLKGLLKKNLSMRNFAVTGKIVRLQSD